MGHARQAEQPGGPAWDAAVSTHVAYGDYRPALGPHRRRRAQPYHFGFATDLVFTREGGSIGAVPAMEQVLGAPVVFLGLSLPEHGYHAPNEFFDWEQAEGGIAAFAHYFASLA